MQDPKIKIGISLFLLIGTFLILETCYQTLAFEDKDIIRVEASVDKEEVYIGEEILFSVNVHTRPHVEIEFPDVQENLGPLVIKDRREKKRSSIFGRSVFRQEYLLTTYTVGKHPIPPIIVKYRLAPERKWSQARTNEITINVKSILAQDPNPKDIRDIKGPLSIPRSLIPFIAGLLVISTALLFFLVRFLKKRTLLKEEEPPKLPYQIACEELERIRESKLIEKGLAKEYYTRLSDCIRHYLEGAFNLRAPEMTTEEFLLSVRDSEALSAEHKSLLKNFLSSCDMVKFAKYGPGREEMESSFQSAKNFVEQTKPEDSHQGESRPD